MSAEYRGPSREEMGLGPEQPEREETPESLIEEGERQKDIIVEEIKKEGEMVLLRLNQALDAATGKKLPEGILREIITGLPKQVTDIKTYREAVRGT